MPSCSFLCMASLHGPCRSGALICFFFFFPSALLGACRLSYTTCLCIPVRWGRNVAVLAAGPGCKGPAGRKPSKPAAAQIQIVSVMLKCFSLLLSQVPLVDGGESLFSEEELLAELPPLSAILGMPATEAGGEHAYHHGGYEYLVDDRDLIKAGQGWTCACPCVRWLRPSVRSRLCTILCGQVVVLCAAHRGFPPAAVHGRNVMKVLLLSAGDPGGGPREKRLVCGVAKHAQPRRTVARLPAGAPSDGCPFRCPLARRAGTAGGARQHARTLRQSGGPAAASLASAQPPAGLAQRDACRELLGVPGRAPWPNRGY